jgi:hypothetical protein
MSLAGCFWGSLEGKGTVVVRMRFRTREEGSRSFHGGVRDERPRCMARAVSMAPLGLANCKLLSDYFVKTNVRSVISCTGIVA